VPKVVKAIKKPFGFLFRKVPKPEGETVVLKTMIWSRRVSFFLLAACPLLLLYQLAGWVEVRFWYDISIGSFLFPDSETARQFSHGSMRILNDMLWIPLWFECLAGAIILFATHMILWNRLDMKRQERRRARRTTAGGGGYTQQGSKRRKSSR